MDTSSLAPGTLEVLNDLLHERGLTEWRVAHHVRVSEDSGEEVDIIYGFALTTSLQEDRIDRKRKRKASTQQTKTRNDEGRPTWSCFLVLPATYSRAAPTLSIKRLLELHQCAEANEPTAGSVPATKLTFLCLTDAGNIRSSSTMVVYAAALGD